MIAARVTSLIDLVRQNVVAVGIAVLSALLLGGAFLTALLFLLPQWTLRAELMRQIPVAEAALQAAAQTGQPPEDMQVRVTAAEVALAQRANVFLTTLQAREITRQWHDAAAQYGVIIVELQALPAPATPHKPVYDRRAFRLTATGAARDLVAFTGALRAAALPTVVIENLQLNAPDTAVSGTLTLELALYTSPFAANETLPLNPVSGVQP